MAPRVSRDDRLRIIKLSKGGMPMRAISAEIGCALGTVLRVVRAYRDEGRVSDASRAGRRRATTEHEDLMIVAAVVDEPFLSAAEIKEELGIPASEATVRARLREAGLTCWNSNTKLRLSPGFKEIRLKFASEHRDWTVAQWQGVVFTNESTICCKWDKNRAAWRPLHNWNDPIYTRQLAASGHVAINVWTMVTYQGLGPIHRVDGGSLCPDDYVDVIDHTMVPFLLDGPFRDGGFILQQDPSPTYRSRTVPRSGAPGDSSKSGSGEGDSAMPSPDELWALIKKEWDKLRELPNITGGFYMALPDKMAEVVAAKGGATAFRETGDEGAGQDSLELATSANGAVLLNSG
ncbi:hypothetical protein HPB47_025708 [Ixodes persulcatus]|uniref:Uncharacterized protein n=1 Tax=Ixodes persulcatus TaxID=34615 RepID=A0AC60Q2J2_IXOPE|nr:hypothetical protein HPB47_025708 [Ixodes persulcatus]